MFLLFVAETSVFFVCFTANHHWLIPSIRSFFLIEKELLQKIYTIYFLYNIFAYKRKYIFSIDYSLAVEYNCIKELCSYMHKYYLKIQL